MDSKNKLEEEKTHKKKLKESLDRNSKEWNELPEWVKKAIRTELVFNVRKPNE